MSPEAPEYLSEISVIRAVAGYGNIFFDDYGLTYGLQKSYMPG